MTDLVQKMAPQILEEIKKAKNILLHCHPNPDADSVGGVFAMMHVLEAMGKQVTAIQGDSEMIEAYGALPGFDKVVRKNFFEVDLNQFDLFLILDSGDPTRISRLDPIVFPPNLKTIAIDHHGTNASFAQINLIDPVSPATCQILYELFTAWGVQITTDIAKCLIVGLYVDTGGFKYPPTNSTTFTIAAHLAEIAPDYTDVIAHMENSNTPGVIAYEALALSSVMLCCGGKAAISAVSYDTWQEKKIKKSDLSADVASILRSVIGWQIGVKIIEDEKGGVKIGFRTRDEKVTDVAKIAKVLGGGGHAASAGVYLRTSFEDAVKKVVSAIETTYPELGK